jgi:hypothetical protein
MTPMSHSFGKEHARATALAERTTNMCTRMIPLAAALTLFALIIACPAGSAYAAGTLPQDTNSDWVISDAELAAATTSWSTGGISTPLLLDLEDFQSAGAYHWDATANKYIAGASGTPAYPMLPSTLGWSTFVGGNSYDRVYGTAYDAQGNAYVTGYTRSTDFPTLNGVQPTISGTASAFVTKIKPSGELEWSTYLGGTGGSHALALGVDTSGNVIVYGDAGAGFPLVNAFQTAVGACFITKLSPSGSIIWSSYFGSGSGNDWTWPGAMVLDSSGNAFIVGATQSPDMPVLNAFQSTYGGYLDYFVAKVSSAGQLVFSSYLGGSLDDLYPGGGTVLAVNSQGNLFVTGYTSSTDFPTTHAFRTTLGGTPDAFVSKISANGILMYSTYLGGSCYY